MMNYISSDDGISNQNILLFLVSIMIIFTFAGNKYIVKIHSIPIHDNIGSSHSLFVYHHVGSWKSQIQVAIDGGCIVDLILDEKRFAS